MTKNDALFHCVTHGHDTYCELTSNGDVVLVCVLILIVCAAIAAVLAATK